MESKKPRYIVTQEPHPDDADGESDSPAHDYTPREGEGLADILRRNNALSEAARRMMQGLDAKLPQGWPDYRNRVYAATILRDTVEGTPDRRAAPKKTEGEAPEPGSLRIARPKIPKKAQTLETE